MKNSYVYFNIINAIIEVKYVQIVKLIIINLSSQQFTVLM